MKSLRSLPAAVVAAALLTAACENGATPPRLAESVAVTAPAASLMEGDTMRLSTAVRDVSGNVIDRPVTWSSSSDAVATVSAAGTVLGVAPGAVTITAAADGKSGSVELTIASLVSIVQVTAPATSMVEGDTMRLAAVARDAAGNPLTGRAVTWSSSSDAVATVSAGGTVTAVSAGTVTITATVEGKSGSVELTVAPALGTLRVSVETVGDLPDPDGYEITRDGQAVGRVGVNGSLEMQDMEVGSYSVGLRDASLYCGIEGDSVRSATVQGGATATVAFRVECRRNGIAYLTHADRRASLWVHFPGRAPHLLASGISGTAVDWSPDGRRIVFAGTSGFPDLPGIGSGIYIIDLDSLGMTRIASRNSSAPVWSPDGSTIVYSAYDFSCCGSVVIVSPDGTGETVIWQSDSNVTHAPSLAWSPDGRRIAFDRANASTAKSDIVVVDRNGSGLQVVKTLGTAGRGVAWSPDGDRLLYGSPVAGQAVGLYTVDLTTGWETLVYRKPGENVLNPSYISGGRIGFGTRDAQATAGGNTGFWTIMEDGSGLSARPLPSDVVEPYTPAWQ